MEVVYTIHMLYIGKEWQKNGKLSHELGMQ